MAKTNSMFVTIGLIICMVLFAVLLRETKLKIAGDESLRETYLEKMQSSMFHGGAWQEWSEKEKKTYLFGLEDGALNVAAYYKLSWDERNRAVKSLPSFGAAVSRDMLIQTLDDFYSDPNNINVAIPHAVLRITNQVLGIEDPLEEKQNTYFSQELQKFHDNQKNP